MLLIIRSSKGYAVSLPFCLRSIQRRQPMNYKLLVAEDVSEERNALVSTLKKHLGGFVTILEAGDGQEAMNLCRQEKPDVLILNIEMPFFSGLDVARAAREESIPCAILFISDYDNFSYAKQAIALRALDYILQPYEEEKLILSIQEAIAHVSQPHPAISNPLHSVMVSNSADEEAEAKRITIVREDISAYIDRHYMEELSMKTVARAMNYSDAYFCKLFKQCFQVNFSAYLNEYRIRKASSMMANPRLNIKDIGLACGYVDSNYFSRVFKRFTGQTPTEYRLSLMEKVIRN